MNLTPKELLAEHFKNTWHEDLPDEQYHEIKNHIGSSTLRVLLQSPKAFYYRVFKGAEQKETEALRLGRIIHTAILEGPRFKEKYRIIPEFTGLTKDGRPSAQSGEARAKKAAWFADLPKGAIATSREDLEVILGIVDSIQSYPPAWDLLQDGKGECSGFYTDPETKIRLKIRPDFLSNNFLRLIDLKSTVSSELRMFGSQVFKRHYDVQLAMQVSGSYLIHGVLPREISLIAVEKLPPYECAVFDFTAEEIESAMDTYRGLLIKLRKCIDTNHWPQRQTQSEHVFTPGWHMKETVEMDGVSEQVDFNKELENYND